jgi:hypothetical protein
MTYIGPSLRCDRCGKKQESVVCVSCAAAIVTEFLAGSPVIRTHFNTDHLGSTADIELANGRALRLEVSRRGVQLMTVERKDDELRG